MIDLDDVFAALNRDCKNGYVLHDEIAEFVGGLRQAEKDAARYRWLRDQCCGDWEVDGVEMPHIEVTKWTNDGFDNCNQGESLHGAEMDSAIDGAMSERNGGYL